MYYTLPVPYANLLFCIGIDGKRLIWLRLLQALDLFGKFLKN